MAHPYLMIVASLLLSSIGSTYAYIIDAACSAVQRQAIIDAVNEALSLAEYASWRVQTNNPALDAYRTQMMGNNGLESGLFQTQMDALTTTVGTLTANPFTGTPDQALDGTVLIRCGDAAAVPVPGEPDKWYDRDFLNNFVPVPYNPPGIVFESKDFALTAYTRKSYNQPNVPGPHHIIYLNTMAFTDQTTIGTDWRTLQVAGRTISQTGEYLSATMLHELLHCQTGARFQPPLLGRLPSGLEEQYGWGNIVPLSDVDKQANAESYTLLATALYFKWNTISTNRGVLGRRFSRDRRPGNSPNDGHA